MARTVFNFICSVSLAVNGLHAGQSKSRGGPTPARCADAGVAARHCQGNGSRAMGRDTIMADRERHVQRHQRRRLRKVCGAEASDTKCCESCAGELGTHMYVHVCRYDLAFCRRKAVSNHKTSHHLPLLLGFICRLIEPGSIGYSPFNISRTYLLGGCNLQPG